MTGPAQETSWRMAPQGPPISQPDLDVFFQHHFSDEAVAAFGQTFQNPAGFQNSYYEEHEEEYTPQEDEDDLGYYEDGVKRTLTDEQIEMFRQSELRELRRKQEKDASTKSETKHDDSNDMHDSAGQSALSGHPTMPSSSRGNKKKRKKGSAKPRHEPKPDLRKRTWDVVEAGLDTLEYD
ncbi:hypothetical protein HIM_03046 [Hirsutella minnesotensis 3608]|nr:hypothetical protein HIM_03046 [Hirsutella minnesotensis 3608]